MTTPAISAIGLSKSFQLQRERRTSLRERFVRGSAPPAKEFWALRDASFEIERGSYFGIIGHNGSGKSTALKVLAGIYRPTAGTVAVNGRVSALLELGAGFHPELTGRENIRMNAALLGMGRRQIRDSMDEIIDFSGIEAFVDSPVKVYSSGMQVRLGFSVAVHMQPEILMVDEVIAVGDEEFQRKCHDYLFELRQRGTTIVMVSHALGAVETSCDAAMWLDHGRVRSLGPAREVVKNYVDEVNGRESRKERETRSGPTTALDEVRHGSGEIQVQSVEYLDESGQPRPFLVSGEPATMRVHYEASKDVAAVDFGVVFITEGMIGVHAPNSRRVGPWDIRSGRGHVDFVVPELLPQPGSYWLCTAVVSGDHCFDFINRGFELKIRAGGRAVHGLVAMPGDWVSPIADGPGADVPAADVDLSDHHALDPISGTLP